MGDNEEQNVNENYSEGGDSGAAQLENSGDEYDELAQHFIEELDEISTRQLLLQKRASKIEKKIEQVTSLQKQQMFLIFVFQAMLAYAIFKYLN